MVPSSSAGTTRTARSPNPCPVSPNHLVAVQRFGQRRRSHCRLYCRTLDGIVRLARHHQPVQRIGKRRWKLGDLHVVDHQQHHSGGPGGYDGAGQRHDRGARRHDAGRHDRREHDPPGDGASRDPEGGIHDHRHRARGLTRVARWRCVRPCHSTRTHHPPRQRSPLITTPPSATNHTLPVTVPLISSLPETNTPPTVGTVSGSATVNEGTAVEGHRPSGWRMSRRTYGVGSGQGRLRIR